MEIPARLAVSAKAALDEARQFSAGLARWLALAMFVGAFAAAAIEGGRPLARRHLRQELPFKSCKLKQKGDGHYPG